MQSLRYLTEPKMVYISFPTEQGTLYTKRELCDISAVCKNTACICLLMVREWDMDWAQIK